MTPPTKEDKDFEEYKDSDGSPRVVPDVEDFVDLTGRVLSQQPVYDKLLNADIAMNLGDDVAAIR